MKRTIAVMMGVAVAWAAFAGTIAVGADNGKAAQAPCQMGQGGQGQCPFGGQGLQKGRKGGGDGQGQQYRKGQRQGQGQGQGKGMRQGPRDGSGPKRDGSCGQQCPAIAK